MGFEEQSMKLNLKRAFIIGSVYTSLEVVGLILSTLGFFQSDIRLFVMLIVLFHILILPFIYIVHREESSYKHFASRIIHIYISVIMAWGTTFTTLVYLQDKDLTILTIVLLLCAALFIVNPKTFRIILLLNYLYYAVLVSLSVSNKLVVNELWFKGLLFFILASIISQMHYKENYSSYNLRRMLLDKASRDSLSGLYNNAYIFKYLENKINEYISNEPMAVLMMDIDNFKYINDQYGHLFGDEVIKRISEVLVYSTTAEDLLGRYGGEEFIVVLNQADIDRTIKVAELIRSNIENMTFEHPVKVTMSIGISFYKGENAVELIKKADDQLYRAKKLGKNRVVRDEEA